MNVIVKRKVRLSRIALKHEIVCTYAIPDGIDLMPAKHA